MPICKEITKFFKQLYVDYRYKNVVYFIKNTLDLYFISCGREVSGELYLFLAPNSEVFNSESVGGPGATFGQWVWPPGGRVEHGVEEAMRNRKSLGISASVLHHWLKRTSEIVDATPLPHFKSHVTFDSGQLLHRTTKWNVSEKHSPFCNLINIRTIQHTNWWFQSLCILLPFSGSLQSLEPPRQCHNKNFYQSAFLNSS